MPERCAGDGAAVSGTTGAAGEGGADGWVWAEPWTPGPELRAVRHRVANLLVPVVVAAELLDGEGPETSMLVSGVETLRRSLDRFGELLRLPPPELRIWDVTELAAALELPLTGAEHGDLVEADAAGLAERLCDELAQGGRAGLSAYCAELVTPDWSGRALCIRSDADGEPLSAEALVSVAVPFSSPRAGAGLAIAAAEAHRHGGRLRGRTDAPVVEVVLPLAATATPDR